MVLIQYRQSRYCSCLLLLLLGLCLVAASNAQSELATTATGGSESHENMQPFTTLNWAIATAEVPDGQDGGFSIDGAQSFRFLGEVAAFTFGSVENDLSLPLAERFRIEESFVPAGWMKADGRLLNIADHPKLFSVLGNVYGGDGTTTFAIPDLRGRTPIGVGDGPGLAPISLGQVVGEETSILSIAEIPAHAHSSVDRGDTPSAGGGQPHNNMMPSLGLNCMVITMGDFPSQSKPGSGVEPSQASSQGRFLAELRMYAGDVTQLPGALPCDGRLLDINSNLALFSLLGANFGGDGRTSFRIPDMRGRAFAHFKNDFFNDFRFAQKSGNNSATLTLNNLPTHMHQILSPLESSGSVGGDQSHNNLQAALAINMLLSLQGVFPAPDTASPVDDTFMGEVLLFAGNFAIRGFAPLDGQVIQIASNSALFSLIGSTYDDEFDGSTFQLPDLRSRLILAEGAGPNLANRKMGEVGGASGVTLTVAQMPRHAHGEDTGLLCWATKAHNDRVITSCL